MTSMQGIVSAGHPVDVASGVLFEANTDFRLDGRMPLEFKRHYSTALLDSPAGILGPGWAASLDCLLRWSDESIEFVDESGGMIRFETTPERLRTGEVVRALGAFLELRLESDGTIVVTSWNTETFLVTRYLFESPTRFETAVTGPANGTAKLKGIENTAGYGVDLFYNENEQLVRAAQRRERRALSFDYDAAGRLVRLGFQGSDGETQSAMHYEYDPNGRLNAIRDPVGASEQYEYDLNGRLTRIVQKDGAVWSFQFDDRGRCIVATGQNNFDFKSFRYFDATRTTEVTDSHGFVTKYHWLPTGQVWQQVAPSGATTFTRYDEFGRITESVDAVGGVETNEYDDVGNLASSANALGQVTAYTHNDRRQITSVTLPNGALIERRYDQQGRIIAVEGPCESSGQFRWNRSGDLESFTNARGEQQHFQYNAFGDVIRTEDCDGTIVRFEYDAFGKKTKRINHIGVETELAYDAMFRLTQISDSNGKTTRFRYDRAGNRIRESGSDGFVRTHTYGTCGRLTETVEPDGRRLRYQWDTEPGRLLSLSLNGDQTYRYEYDSDGRTRREISYDGRTLTFERDPAGLIRSVTNGAGEITQFDRDIAGQITRITNADGAIKEYQYDALNLMVAAVNEASEVEFERDQLGRIVVESQNGVAVTSTYDGFGIRTSLKSDIGLDVVYEYQSALTPKSVTVNGTSTFRFEHDYAGREQRRVRDDSFEMQLIYGDAGQLTEQWVGRNNAQPGAPERLQLSDTVMAHRRYSYDDAGELARVEDARFGTSEYRYDEAGRLTEQRRESETFEQFSYDARGTRSRWAIAGAKTQADGQFGVEVGLANQVLTQDDAEFVYDSDGRLTHKIVHRGTDSEQTWDYHWDSEGFLTSVVLPTGQEWFYDYDALGRRVCKRGPDVQLRYIWDDHFILHELREESTQGTDAAQTIETWVYEPDGLRPIATVQSGECFGVITDQVGAPRELIDADGKVVWSARYLAWGKLDEQTIATEGVGCDLRFPGQWFDPESGLHYNRFRYYSPDTATYISRDPIRLDGGLLEYAYVPNPCLWIDFFGLDAAGVKSGPENETVYVVREGNKPDGDVLYVGITKQDVSDRQSQHRQDPSRKNWVLMPLTDTEGNEIRVRHGVAKGIEQGLIDHYGIQNPGPTQGLKKGPLVNEINSMSPNRDSKVRKPRMKAGKPYVDEFLENEKTSDKRGQCTK
ncbi:RHS repeat-associated core domain-containing protein [Roseiconus lacunae]|uniref:RHS repeat-associated core domain-containing protein n=1 Tax=Roseiconus lacunae TaxID=2605694 RepID=UPI0011F22B54|nr:RHS repeat-associated core domain-containing protein [Roseiconus lacunae]